MTVHGHRDSSDRGYRVSQNERQAFQLGVITGATRLPGNLAVFLFPPGGTEGECHTTFWPLCFKLTIYYTSDSGTKIWGE